MMVDTEYLMNNLTTMSDTELTSYHPQRASRVSDGCMDTIEAEMDRRGVKYSFDPVLAAVLGFIGAVLFFYVIEYIVWMGL